MYEGYPLIHKKAINTSTFQLEYKGYDNYPKDANGNYSKMFWSDLTAGKLDTTVLHLIDISYTGSNATNYVIKTFNSNKYAGIRHATATYTGANVTKVTSLDTAFSVSKTVPSTTVDSFNYDGMGNLISHYMLTDTGAGMEMKERDIYSFSGGTVKLHTYAEWDVSTSQFKIVEQVSLFYNGNTLLDSANYGDDLYHFTYDANGKITSTTFLEEDGSGGFDFKIKAEVAYNTKGKIKDITYSEYQGGAWAEYDKRTTTYNAGDSLVKVTSTRKFGPQAITFGEWIYGDTSAAPAPTVPAAPTNLAALIGSRAASTKAVDLTWKDNSTDELGFVVERAGSGAFAIHATLAADVIAYKDTTNLEEATTYKYRVYATNAAGNSTNSNEVTAAIPANGTDTNVNVTEVKDQMQVMLYPNPANESFTIQSNTISQLSIVNIVGNEVYQQELTSNEEIINTESFENGLYMILLKNENGVKISRVVIRH